jgi:hypothetical protein
LCGFFRPEFSYIFCRASPVNPPFWLKNRDPARWRDAWQVEHSLGKFVISDKPLTEEQWALERADVIDVSPDTPALPEGTGKPKK